jgi:hypothetical protein
MKATKMLTILVVASAIMVWTAEVSEAAPMGTAFTYQGRLIDKNRPADGLYDFQFKLYDSNDPCTGSQQGSPIDINDLDVLDGHFTVELDFGSGIFDGNAVWLATRVVQSPLGSDPCTLSPLLELTATPYALHAKKAENAAALDSANTFTTGVQEIQTGGASNKGLVVKGAASQSANLQEWQDSTGSALAYVDAAGVFNGDGSGLSNLPAGTDSDWTISDSNMYTGAGVTGNVGIGTTTPTAKLTVNGAILRDGSTMHGSSASTHINLGVNSTTGTSGQNYGYCTVGGGQNNSASSTRATVGGGANNTASGYYATIGGGYGNDANGTWYTTVGGGANNTASGSRATVGGGENNTASGDYATVGGGVGSTASGTNTAIGGGYQNTASGLYATVPGGYENGAAGNFSFAAGRQAKADHDGSFVWGDSTGGDFASTANDQFLIDALGGVGIGTTNPTEALDVNGTAKADAFVGDGSGLSNLPAGTDSDWTISGPNMYTGAGVTGNVGIGTTTPTAKLTVNGGILRSGSTMYGATANTHINLGMSSITGSEIIDMSYCTVSGGRSNTASSWYATVGGGYENDANDYAATVGGGYNNDANGGYVTVGGGKDNTASGGYATVGGGQNNTTSNTCSTVGGGKDNTASGIFATVGGGSENTASGQYATVPGGLLNTAGGTYSFAAGRRAKANYHGVFAWADSANADFDVNVNDRFAARARGGVYFYTNSSLTSGVYVSAGGNSWNSISDRATKENFVSVDKRALLEQLATMPITEYNIKAQDDSIRHIGPVAQDFATFGYGESDKAINMEDADGIALAAIQGLYELVQEKEAEIAALKERMTAMEGLVARLARFQQGGAK